MTVPVIAAVLFDLDDTLYPQAAWLGGAWAAVADGAPAGLDRIAFHDALVAVAAGGSDRGAIIDRALAAVGARNVAVGPLVAAFRGHAPAHLDPYPGARDVIAAVRERVPVALVTDGDVDIQCAKIRALGLEDAFDAVVLSDALGRQHRKPHPAPFLEAATRLGAEPASCVMVGDRPDKDTRGARLAGLLGSVRIRAGEYADSPDENGRLIAVDSVVEAGAWILRQLDRAARQSPDPTRS